MAVGGIFVTLRAITSKFEANMSKAKAAVDRFRTSTVNINRQLKKVGKQMTKVGKSMSANFTLPIVAAGGLAVKTFADFEQEMAKVQAVSGATGEEFKKLEKLAKDLGASTRFTASEVATLELNYSKLGFVPEQIRKITKPTLDLALATGEDLAQSAEVAGGTLRAFGLTAKQMPRLVDLMAKSFSSSALTLEKFKDAMKSAAPVANAVGATLEDTTAIISTLVDANIDASTAGTSLRNIFLELSAKGLTWNQAMKKIKTSTDKAATANELFGKRAVAAALVIANNTEKLDQLKKEYKNAGGAAKTMANIMDATLKGSLLRVQSAVEGAAIELGEVLAPVIQKVGEFIADLAVKFTELSPKTKKIIAVVAGLTAAAGPLLVVLGTLAGTVLPLMVTGIAALASPIGLLIAGIAALAVGFAAMELSAGNVNKELSLNEKVTKRINAVSNKFNTNLKNEQKNIASVFETLKDENTSKEIKRLLTSQINAEYGDYLPSLLTENSSLQDIKIAQEAINKSMTKRIALMLGQEEVVEIVKEFRKEEQRLQSILKTSGFTSQQIKIIQEGASSLEALAEATSLGANKFIEINGELIQVSQVVSQLTTLENDQKTAVNEVTKAYEDLISTTAGLPDAPPIVPKDLGAIGGIAKKEAVRKIKPTEGKELIPLIIQLQRAREEAELFSKAFSDEPENALIRQRDALKTFINESLKANDEITPAIQQQIDIYDQLGLKIKEITDGIKANAERTAAFIDNIKSQIATSLGESIGEALVSGDPAAAFKEFIKDLLNVVKAFGSTLIAIGLGLTASIFGIVEGPKTIAAGIALIAAATAGAALFAQGGLVFGETLGIIGEGRGTTRSNPEVIAPLDKLQGMIGGGGGGGGGTVVFRISGSELRGVLRNADIRSGFMSSGTNLKT